MSGALGVYVRGVRHGARQSWRGRNGNGNGDVPIDYNVLWLDREKREGKVNDKLVELKGHLDKVKGIVDEINGELDKITGMLKEMAGQLKEMTGQTKVSEGERYVLMKSDQAMHRRKLLHYGVKILNPPRPWLLRKFFNAKVHIMDEPTAVWVDDEAGKRMVVASPKLMRFMLGEFVLLEKGALSLAVVHLSTPRDIAEAVHMMELKDERLVSKATYVELFQCMFQNTTPEECLQSQDPNWDVDLRRLLIHRDRRQEQDNT